MMFLITMVLSSQAAQESVRLRLARGQAERQCVYAMNNDGVAPIFDDTAGTPVYIVKGSNQEMCPHGHQITPFVTDKETWCSECYMTHPADTPMHKCLECEKKGFGRDYCIGCTDTMDGTYKKLAGGIKITKSQCAQSEGCSVAFKSPYKFGRHKGKYYVLDICGDHVWRNEKSNLLMLRSPIIRNNNWGFNFYNQKQGELTGKETLFYPCFQTHAWIIVKWPTQYPHLAVSNGAKQVDYGVEYKGFRRGKTFASFCGLPEELEMDFAERANEHLPATSEEQLWVLPRTDDDLAPTFTVARQPEEHKMQD